MNPLQLCRAQHHPLHCNQAFYSVILALLQCALGSLAPTNLLTTRVGPCTKAKKHVVSVSEMSIVTRVYDSSVSGQFNISEDIKNDWQVKATMLKCQDLRNLDTCDFFKTFLVLKHGCTDDASPEYQDLSSIFFHHTSPRVSCPVRAGHYKIEGYPFFTEDNYMTVSEAKISTSLFGYTYKLEGFQGKRSLFCVEAYLQLLYVREHNWIDEPRDVAADEPATAAPRDTDDSAGDQIDQLH